MKVYSYTGKGNRETNEDYIKSESLSNNVSLHIIADGMGGYQYGEVAAQVATETIFQFIKEKVFECEIQSLIQQAVEFANKQILLKQHLYHAKLGTTLAGILIKDLTGYVFWLGDVQIQHFRNNHQLFISESHSLINEMKRIKVISAKEVERYKHIVTKYLSGSPLDASVPIVEIQLHPEDILCISSDGLYNSISPSSFIYDSDILINRKLDAVNTLNTDNMSIIRISSIISN